MPSPTLFSGERATAPLPELPFAFPLPPVEPEPDNGQPKDFAALLALELAQRAQSHAKHDLAPLPAESSKAAPVDTPPSQASAPQLFASLMSEASVAANEAAQSAAYSSAKPAVELFGKVGKTSESAAEGLNASTEANASESGENSDDSADDLDMAVAPFLLAVDAQPQLQWVPRHTGKLSAAYQELVKPAASNALVPVRKESQDVIVTEAHVIGEASAPNWISNTLANDKSGGQDFDATLADMAGESGAQSLAAKTHATSNVVSEAEEAEETIIRITAPLSLEAALAKRAESAPNTKSLPSLPKAENLAELQAKLNETKSSGNLALPVTVTPSQSLVEQMIPVTHAESARISAALPELKAPISQTESPLAQPAMTESSKPESALPLALSDNAPGLSITESATPNVAPPDETALPTIHPAASFTAAIAPTSDVAEPAPRLQPATENSITPAAQPSSSASAADSMFNTPSYVRRAIKAQTANPPSAPTVQRTPLNATQPLKTSKTGELLTEAEAQVVETVQPQPLVNNAVAEALPVETVEVAPRALANPELVTTDTIAVSAELQQASEPVLLAESAPVISVAVEQPDTTAQAPNATPIIESAATSRPVIQVTEAIPAEAATDATEQISTKASEPVSVAPQNVVAEPVPMLVVSEVVAVSAPEFVPAAIDDSSSVVSEEPARPIVPVETEDARAKTTDESTASVAAASAEPVTTAANAPQAVTAEPVAPKPAPQAEAAAPESEKKVSRAQRLSRGSLMFNVGRRATPQQETSASVEKLTGAVSEPLPTDVMPTPVVPVNAAPAETAGPVSNIHAPLQPAMRALLNDKDLKAPVEMPAGNLADPVSEARPLASSNAANEPQTFAEHLHEAAGQHAERPVNTGQNALREVVRGVANHAAQADTTPAAEALANAGNAVSAARTAGDHTAVDHPLPPEPMPVQGAEHHIAATDNVMMADQAARGTQVAEVQSAETVEAEPVLRQIAQPLIAESEQLKPGNPKTLRLKLRPEELGQVEVELTRDVAGRLHAHLTVEHEQTHRLLRDELGQLRNALEQAGWQVEQLAISTQQPHSGWHAGGQSPNSSSQQGDTPERFDRFNVEPQVTEPTSNGGVPPAQDRLLNLHA